MPVPKSAASWQATVMIETQHSLAESLTFKYVPRPGLFKIALINFGLNLITLTIYRFWAKTNVRKHVWSCIHINDEPLEYTGTGNELFKGFLVVFGLFILPYIILNKALQIYLGESHPLVLGLSALFLLFVYVMIGFALYRARKYQLSRTNWRGIRGALVGSALTYSLTYFGAMLAKLFSFGWATPVMNTVLQEQIIGDMRFGDAAFKFKGRAAPLYPTYALCWFLTALFFAVGLGLVAYELFQVFGPGLSIALDRLTHPQDQGEPTRTDLWNIWTVLGLLVALFILYLVIFPLLWAIYSAKEMRSFANYTRFDGAQFSLNARTGSIFLLVIGNLLLIVFTLGIANPFVIQRNIRYVISRLTLEGAVDIDRIQQSQAAMPKRGEGLADAFELGAW
jgi:uncharacterized membrane protein YjgN (DUF898 family)